MEKENLISEEEPKFEMTPEEATSLGGGSPGVFNRKKVLIFICIALAVFVMLGVIFNAVKTSKKSNSSANDEFAASRSNSSFLASLRDSALRESGRRRDSEPGMPDDIEQMPVEEPLLPPVSFNSPRENEPARSPPPAVNQPPPQYAAPLSPQQPDSHFRSPLVPQIQGSLFSRNAAAQQNGQNYSSQQNAPSSYDDYLNRLNSRISEYQTQGTPAQNNQQGGQNFYESSNPSGAVYEGRFLGENALWLGTVIPGILETAVNTDLPGHVLAHVTQKYLRLSDGQIPLCKPCLPAGRPKLKNASARQARNLTPNLSLLTAK